MPPSTSQHFDTPEDLEEIMREGKFRTKAAIDRELSRRQALRMSAWQPLSAAHAADCAHGLGVQHPTQPSRQTGAMATVWSHLDAVYCVEGGDLLTMVAELLAAAGVELQSGAPIDRDGLALLLTAAGREVQQVEQHLRAVVEGIAEFGLS